MFRHHDMAEANDSRVSLAGRPLCTTTNSQHLDREQDAATRYKYRDLAAARIALCWNACRHLSNGDLERMIAERTQ